jgi:hypothetical protein
VKGRMGERRGTQRNAPVPPLPTTAMREKLAVLLPLLSLSVGGSKDLVMTGHSDPRGRI